MNFGFVSADTLERSTRLQKEFQTPTFTFTFASPSSSPLKRAVSEPAQKESDPLLRSEAKPVSNEIVPDSKVLFGCLSPPFSHGKYFELSTLEDTSKTVRHYSSLDNHTSTSDNKTNSMINGHSKSTSSQLNVNKSMKPKCPSDNLLKKHSKFKSSGYSSSKAPDNQIGGQQIKVEYRHCRSLTTSLSNVKSVLVPVLNSLEKLASCSKQMNSRRLRKADVVVKMKNKNKSVETLVTQSELEVDAEKTDANSSTSSRKGSRTFWSYKKATSSTNVLALDSFNKPKDSYINNGMETSDLSVLSSDSCPRTVVETSEQVETSPEDDLPERIENPRKDSEARRRRKGYELTRHVAGHCFTSLLASPTEESDSQVESVQLDSSPTSTLAKTPSVPKLSQPPAPVPILTSVSHSTANIEASTSTAYSQYFFKPIHTAPISSQNFSSACFPFFFPGKERHHKSNENTTDSNTGDGKQSGCFGSNISHKILSAVRPGDKRSHSGRRKHPSAGTIRPKPTHPPTFDVSKAPQQRNFKHPQAFHSRFSLAGTGVQSHFKASYPPQTAPVTGEEISKLRFRFRFSSGGYMGLKRNRQGTILENRIDRTTSNQSTHARSSSIDMKPREGIFERKYPAPQYFSVDCIDAVEISSSGRFVSRLAEKRSKFKDSHDRKLYRTSTVVGRGSEKFSSEKKRWNAEDASHQPLSSSIHSQTNYNTFSCSNSGYGFVKNPNINITINSSSSGSKSPSPTSETSAHVHPPLETLTPPMAPPADASNEAAYINNGSNFIKEQIWSFLKPTDNKLAMKLFGNKKLASKEKAKRAKQSQQRSWIIHPRSTLRLYWDLLMFGLLLTNIVILPLAISFFTESILLGYKWIFLNCLCDVVFLTDILLNFRTGIILDSYTNAVIVSPEKICRHYLRTWFVLDFLSSLPFDVIIVFFTSHSNAPHIAYAGRALRVFRFVKFVSLLRLLRLSRVGRYINQLRVDFGQFFQMASRVMHVLSLVFIILLLGHWNGCLQWFVPMLQHYPGDSWTALENLIDSEWTEQYTWAVFKALSHMLSIGFGRYPPQSTTDVWLTIISMLTGATCYALFVGQSTTIIQSFGISKRLYQEKFQQVEEYMSYMKLPRPLRRNITKYYEHRYRGKMFDETSILAEVNECLHEEIVNFNCRRLISSVSFFEKADQNFVTDLVAKLQSEVFLPGNVIVKEGTLGNKMFFLQEGMVSVLTKNGKCVAKLSDGSYFGEVCLLANTKRVASVKADTYCNVFTLSVEHFVSVLERYPHMRQVMENVAKARVDDCFFEKDETIPSDRTGDQNAATSDTNPVTSPCGASDGDDHKIGCFGLVRRTAKKRKHPKSE